MSSLVLESQQSCLNATIPTVDILRMALVVAKKLRVEELASWLNMELKGYTESTAVPAYRRVHTELVAKNPYHGWVPVMMEDTDMLQKMCTVPLVDAVSTLENMSSMPDAMLHIPLPEGLAQSLMEGMDVVLKPTRRFSGAQARTIVDAVRNAVLDWALKLENEGILGEGMTFSEQEKQSAAHTHFTVNYNGPVGASAIQHVTHHSNQTVSGVVDKAAVGDFIKEVQKNIDALKIDNTDRLQLSSDVETVSAQLRSPNPKRIVLRESLASIRAILENCTGDLLASGLLLKVIPLMNSLNI